MATQIILIDAEFEQFRNIKDDFMTIVRTVKRQPTGCSVHDFSAEVGDKVMYLDWPCYLRESRGRDKVSMEE